ncbi:hemerythrin domain-containing protein [Nonomuraea longispora]|uniref:Hemerythrin domain-containing protein n=1 Tax=Nonomuraea longispora TaxID=1848320 RepID=A0A4R4ME90_9ACTN|nr:hemerythrin domain-containing protein [Nonomuraea longispora]TDB93958.1 hemerythrin domain-containing protein [Nonomuraea longispora]
MNTVRIPAVAPRHDGEREPDLTSMYVIHRAMLTDLRRITEVLGGTDPLTGGRNEAVRAYAASVLTEVHHHHANEDDLLWPIIERTAGHAVDLSPYTDDHQALGPVLDRCRAALRGERHVLRSRLAELTDFLDEHIAEEESDLFPIIFRFVPYDAYAWAERQIAKRASFGQLTFTAPWLLRHATRDEGNRLLAGAGAPLRILLAMTRGRYARHERAAFG